MGKKYLNSPTTKGLRVTEGAWLAECACINQFGALPFKFWRFDEYKDEFTDEIRAANSMLRSFDFKTLQAAMSKYKLSTWTAYGLVKYLCSGMPALQEVERYADNIKSTNKTVIARGGVLSVIKALEEKEE